MRKLEIGLLFVSAFACAVLLAASLSCYSPPPVRTSDTTAEQARMRTIADALDDVPARPENRIVPQDQTTIRNAGQALDQCARTLERKDEEVNHCAGQLAECGRQFEAKAEKLRECQSENGFLGKMGLRAQWFFLGVIAAIVATVILHFTGSLAQILARIRPPGV